MKAGVIVCSDRSFYGEREDKSGPIICDFLSNRGFDVEYKVVPDDKDTIKAAIKYITTAPPIIFNKNNAIVSNINKAPQIIIHSQ